MGARFLNSSAYPLLDLELPRAPIRQARRLRECLLLELGSVTLYCCYFKTGLHLPDTPEPVFLSAWCVLQAESGRPGIIEPSLVKLLSKQNTAGDIQITCHNR
jgi:hypothetical protein